MQSAHETGDGAIGAGHGRPTKKDLAFLVHGSCGQVQLGSWLANQETFRCKSLQQAANVGWASDSESIAS